MLRPALINPAKIALVCRSGRLNAPVAVPEPIVTGKQVIAYILQTVSAE